MNKPLRPDQRPEYLPEDLEPPRNSLVIDRLKLDKLTRDQSREGFTRYKAKHFLQLLFRPRLTETMFPYVVPFTQLQVAVIRHQVRGVILDVDGALVSHHSNDFDPKTLQKIEEMRDHGLQLCVFSNNNQPRPPLEKLKLPFVTNVKAKPHPEGFIVGSRFILGLDPQECAMIGDNLTTDGGAIRAGMNLILVEALPGKEPLHHKLTRGYGRVCKAVHDQLRYYLND